MSEIIFRPQLCLLDQAGKEAIHRAALDILATAGMEVFHEGVRELLLGAGAGQISENLLTIPEAMVTRALETAPSSFTIFDRDGARAMVAGGRRTYFGTGSDLMHHLDAETGRRRDTNLADTGLTARVSQVLENIDFIMSYAWPHDFPAEAAWVRSFGEMVLNSTKPIVTVANDEHDLAAMWEMVKAVRGSAEAAREKPYIIHYAEPTSPLKHPRASMAKILFCAERSIPLIYSPAPMAGSTAPLTPAGHLAQGLAECLTGLVSHQLAAPGAPFLMGMGAAVLDLLTSQSSYNAPEYYLAYLGMIEMSHYYDLPSWGYAGTTDSQVPDQQAGFEAGVLSYLSYLAGANLCHDVGYLDFGRLGSLEFLVMNNEFLSQIRRFGEGIPISEATLAKDVIRTVGSRGNFLTQPHTLKHCRAVQWRPKLLNRDGGERWEKAGSLDLGARSRARLAEILASGPGVPLDRARADRIKSIVSNFRNKS